MTDDLQIIREGERFRKTHISRVHWWRLEKAGQVPKRIALGVNRVGWLKSEIDAWIRERAEAR